jgi:hypothetical protein
VRVRGGRPPCRGAITPQHLEGCQQTAGADPRCHDGVTTGYDLDGLRQTYMDGILQFSDLRGPRQSRLDASNQLGKLMFCH